MMCSLLWGSLVAMFADGPAPVAGDARAKCVADYDLCVREALATIEKSTWFGFGVERMPAEADGTSKRLSVVLIHPQGPATRAGLKTGDILVATDGQPYAFREDGEVLKYFAGRKVGQAARFSVIRGGTLLSIAFAPTFPPPELHRPMLGQYLQAHYGIDPNPPHLPAQESTPPP